MRKASYIRISPMFRSDPVVSVLQQMPSSRFPLVLELGRQVSRRGSLALDPSAYKRYELPRETIHYRTGLPHTVQTPVATFSKHSYARPPLFHSSKHSQQSFRVLHRVR